MNTAANVVKELNDILFGSDLYEHDYFRYLEYVETPTGDFIKYCGLCLWDSENDYREVLEDGEKEDMKGFLIAEIGKVGRVINNVNNLLEKQQ